MMKPNLNVVGLTVFLGILAACGRDDTIPAPPPFPPAEETVVPSSLCRRAPTAFLGPPPEELGAPSPIAQPPTPRLPGQAATRDLQDPNPGVLSSGTPEREPDAGDFPPLPEAPPGFATLGWTGLTPCNQLLPGAFVPPEAAAASGHVAVQTNPTTTGHRLLIQVKDLPATVVGFGEGANGLRYQPWLAARAADGRYLFAALAPFQVTSSTTLLVRPVPDPLLDAVGVAGYPVAITSDGLQAGAPITEAALAFPLLAFRYWFITVVPDTGPPLAARPTVVLSGAARFPVSRLRTSPP